MQDLIEFQFNMQVFIRELVGAILDGCLDHTDLQPAYAVHWGLIQNGTVMNCQQAVEETWSEKHDCTASAAPGTARVESSSIRNISDRNNKFCQSQIVMLNPAEDDQHGMYEQAPPEFKRNRMNKKATDGYLSIWISKGNGERVDHEPSQVSILFLRLLLRRNTDCFINSDEN